MTAATSTRALDRLRGLKTREELYQSRRARWSPMAMPVVGMIVAPMIGERVESGVLAVASTFGVALVTTLGIRQALLAPELWRLRRRMYRPVSASGR